MSCSDVIGDIEDLFSTYDDVPMKRMTKDVVYHSNRKKEKSTKRKELIEKIQSPPVLQSVIPGTQKIYVKTWGCTHNTSDSEYMAGQLAAYGYHITEDKNSADLWLLNSCTVKTPAEDHFKNEINLAQKLSKHIIVAGCVSQGGSKEKFLHGLSVIGVQQIDRVVEVVEETLKGNTVRLLGQKKLQGKKQGGASLTLPKIRRNPLVEIISINTGCLNQCTYCKTKHARGELGSYPIQDIVNRVKQSFEEGVCEIWMTSEDTGAYGRDIGVTLPDLLWQVVEVIPDGCMLRLGMTNPPYILEHLEEMAKILNHPRVYSFLHIPVQSGSDVVLSDMKREYCVDDFKHVVDFLRSKVSNITICTDIICGFPTETEEDFELTMKLCKEYKFPSLFINQFYPRPGTPAFRMARLPTQEVKRRSKELSDFFQSYEPYNGRVGVVYQVLATEESHDKQFYVAHNKNYEQVLIPKQDTYLGKLMTVEITSVGKYYMKGVLLKDTPVIKTSTAPLLKGQISGFHKRTEDSEEDKTYHIAYCLFTIFVMFLARVYYIFWMN